MKSRQNLQDDDSAVPRIVIRPSGGRIAIDWRELWKYRELVYFFAWRDIKVRYKQTLLGATWAIIQPFFTMVVFSIFFGRLAKIPSDNVPYPIFAYTALLPWNYLSGTIHTASNSLVGYGNLIQKTYFPKLIVPLATVMVGLVDFAIATSVLVAMMFYYRIFPTVTLIGLPLFVLMVVVTAFAVGVWASALNVRYRDVRHGIPFLTQFWLFATPIAYPVRIVPDSWRTLYSMNPMVSVVEGFRWALLGKGQTQASMVATSVGVVLVTLITGLLYFRRMEKTFADVV